jgi:hypothetical protein
MGVYHWGSFGMRAHLPHNPSVNSVASVRIFNSANACGGAPVTLIR